MLYIGIFFAILASIMNFIVGSPLIRLLINSLASGAFAILVAIIVQKVIIRSLPSLLEVSSNEVSIGDFNSPFDAKPSKNKKYAEGDISDMEDGIDESLKTASFTNLENVVLDTGEINRAFSSKPIESVASAVRSTLNTKE